MHDRIIVGAARRMNAKLLTRDKQITNSGIVIGGANAQVRNPKPTTTQGEPPLIPLTDAERALDFRGIVANRPDLVANEVFFYEEGFGGFSAKRHVARVRGLHRL